MDIDLTLFGIASIIEILSLGKLIRLIFFRIFYPTATLKQIESFEKNTKRKYTFPSINKKLDFN